MQDKKEKFEYSMAFENLLTLVLGGHYYQWASSANDIILVRRGIKSLISQFVKDVEKLDADYRLKDLCEMYLERIDRQLKNAKTANDFRDLFIDALLLVATMFGYDGIGSPNVSKPRIIHFEQNLLAEFRQAYSRKKDKKSYWQEFSDLKSKLYKTKYEIIVNLKNKKYSNAEIANILNTSAYEIQKIINYKDNAS